MSGAVTYSLKYPIETRDADGNVTGALESITLRRLKGKDIRAIDTAKGGGSATVMLIARSAGIAPAVVDLMDGEDVTEAGAIVAGFLGGTPEAS